MTKLLNQAIAKLKRLPPERQDELAALLLEELEEEQSWDASFGASQEKLADLADSARNEHAAGRSRPMDPAELAKGE